MQLTRVEDWEAVHSQGHTHCHLTPLYSCVRVVGAQTEALLSSPILMVQMYMKVQAFLVTAD